MAENNPGLVLTPEMRVLHPHLFEPQAYIDPRTQKPKGKPAYSFLGMIPMDEEEFNSLKRAAKAVAVAAWGNDVKGVKYPFKSGDAEADRLLAKPTAKGKKRTEDMVKHFRGNYIFKAKSAFPPQVGDKSGHTDLPQNEFYSGMYGMAELNFKAYEISDGDDVKRYVTAYFNFFMKTRDGDRMAGRDFKTVFKGLLGDESTVDVGEADIDIE